MVSLDRRNLLRFGVVQLGAMPLLPAAAAATRPRARACILLFMDGGPSHIDLFDLKPDAPSEIRGPYGSIPTTVPGIRVCEHLPRIAKQMHRLLQIRTVCHEETVHDPAVYQTLTGHKHLSSGGDLKVAPDDFPQLGTVFGKLDGEAPLLPKVIELPETMKMGARILPGQNAGFLGAIWDPFRVQLTPKGEVVRPELDPLPQVPESRQDRRLRLIDRLEQRVEGLDSADPQRLGDLQRQALSILAQPEIRSAFELEREPSSLRERYGRHRHGQSVLLARRLVEAGSRFVTVYWGKEPQDWADGQGPRIANNPWDTHRNHFPLTKDDLAPRADQALSALIDDLHQRGMLDDTLVVWMGEFGRTPRISEFASRDHWPFANTILLSGAGLPGGSVYGKTNSTAEQVTENPVSPADLTATILTLMGVDPRAELRDPGGRPYPASGGAPIRALL